MPPYKGLFGSVTAGMEEQLAAAAQTADQKTDRIIALLERIVEQNDELLKRSSYSGDEEDQTEEWEDIEQAMERQPVPAAAIIQRPPKHTFFTTPPEER